MDNTITAELSALEREMRAYKSAQARLVKDMPTFTATVQLPEASARRKVFIWANGVTASSFLATLMFTGTTSPTNYVIPCSRNGRVGWFVNYGIGQNWPINITANQEATYAVEQLN